MEPRLNDSTYQAFVFMVMTEHWMSCHVDDKPRPNVTEWCVHSSYAEAMARKRMVNTIIGNRRIKTSKSNSSPSTYFMELS